MIIDLGNGYYSIYAPSLEYPLKLEGVNRWIKYLKFGGSNRNRNSTIKNYVQKLDKFFYWTLANHIQFEEDLFDYFFRFSEDAKHGFRINCPVEIDEEIVYYKYAEVGPMDIASFASYEAAIYSFFGVNNSDEKKSLYTDFKNTAFARYIEQYGKLSSLNIKMSKEDMPEKKRQTASNNSLNPRNSEAFPMELFNDLIEMAAPQDKLIYLLCGGTSARIGQVLNLTLYDVNFDLMQVRLIDPRSTVVDDYGNRRKSWLFEKYEIDIVNHPIHSANDLQFKYRIPRTHTYLFWFNEDLYKNMFFHELSKYLNTEYILESDRKEKHPFFFTTKSSKRHRQGYVNTHFHEHCDALSKKNPKYSTRLSSLDGIHSLRHMFGRIMAQYAIDSGDYNILFDAAEAMGINNLASVFIYFKPEEHAIRTLLQSNANRDNSPEIRDDRDIRLSMRLAFEKKGQYGK
jgi:integrase